MRLLSVFFLLFQGVQGTALIEVEGYMGENITLPSSADPSWTLTRIDWSIFPNNTWIATYDNNVTNVDRRPEYKGRLTLHKYSGNLTIRNLRPSDAMKYTVDLVNDAKSNEVNHISLKVKQHLQQPTITKIQSTATKTGCFLVLNCSSQYPDVALSWDVKPSYLHGSKISQSGASELIAFFQTLDPLNVTCTVRKNMENASRPWISKCDSPDNPPTPGDGFGRGFFWGFFTGLLLVVIGCLLYKYRENICKALQQFRDKHLSGKD
uniref:Ig-like domain-containing protein n=1 Tax=Fundulus heteroclitus TaxID=8078 RepID=A0A3Q2PAW8_FUNHE